MNVTNFASELIKSMSQQEVKAIEKEMQPSIDHTRGAMHANHMLEAASTVGTYCVPCGTKERKAFFVGCATALGIDATGSKLVIRERLLNWAGKVQSQLKVRYK